MFETGLTSISFRPHTIEEILGAASRAGLHQMEFGSDVHVPAGDLALAHAVRQETESCGMAAGSYGSYFRLGTSADPAAAIVPYLDTADALGASVIRIWGGTVGSKDLTDAQFDALAAEGQQLAETAAARGKVLALECHPGTLTDEYPSALRYMTAVDHPSIRMYWQPNQNHDHAYNLEAAEALVPYTTNIHVFSWEIRNGRLVKLPLAAHADRWHEYLSIFARHGGTHSLLLEFMHDDRLESLAETAAELNRWAHAFD